MIRERKSRAFNPRYESPSQLELEGFESPFSRMLNPDNRWVVLAKLIPWDEVCSQCRRQLGNTGAGRKPINPRIVIWSLIIKYILILMTVKRYLKYQKTYICNIFLVIQVSLPKNPLMLLFLLIFEKNSALIPSILSMKRLRS